MAEKKRKPVNGRASVNSTKAKSKSKKNTKSSKSKRRTQVNGRNKVKQQAEVQKTRKDQQVSGRSNIQKVSKKKRPPFMRIRMWIYYLLSLLQKDRGKIPSNIGDKILITNNMYVTRYYMSSIICVEVLSLQTPVTFFGEVVKFLRKNSCDALVDVTVKNQRFDCNLKESGMESRIAAWEYSIDAPDISKRQQEISARCLYTVDIVASGQKLMKSRIFLTLRAKTGSKLTRAEKLTFKYLNSIGAEYNLLTGDLREKLEYVSIISNKRSQMVKDIKYIVNSNQTLAQMMPNSSAFNGTKGEYLGNDLISGLQYNLDLESITIARNLYIIAPSGVGKTVLALNLCCSAIEQGMAVCIQDIKGNEFNNFVNATGGYIVSLRQSSSGYINSWRMNKEDTTDQAAESYFMQRLAFSREQMMILSGVSDAEELVELEELLDAFHNGLYMSLGVLASNRNTWIRTRDLSPFVIYEYFVGYMTPEMQRKYSRISRKVINALRMTMSKEGSKSYIFKEEFDHLSILRAPTLMFDFGILEGQSDLTDMTIFKLKFAYMRKLNGEYIAYKYSRGIKTLKILEESQVVANDPSIMKGYVEEFTLRRAQGQTSVLLGNSIAALVNNPMSQSLVENTRGLLIGELAPDALTTVVKYYGLEEHIDLLEMIGKTPEYKNSFVFINRMQDHAIVPILKVILKSGKSYKLFKPVPQNNNSFV